MKNTLLLSTFVLLAAFLPACFSDNTYDEFAQCLTDEGVVYYGAYWCPNCQKQGQLFGASQDLLNYVECAEDGKDSQYERCLLDGVDSFPRWRFADGSELNGTQSLEALSEKSSCPLPGEENEPKSVLFQ